MTRESALDLSVVEQRVCDVTSEQLDIPRDQCLPSSRLIEDLRCDSLDLVELIMELEDTFLVTIPNQPANPVSKSIFTRQPFRLSDLAEIVYLQQGSGKPERQGLQSRRQTDFDDTTVPFSQLSGRWNADSLHGTPALFEPLGSNGAVSEFRRRSDGMRCFLLPAAEINIGSEASRAHPDERPVHTVRLDGFLMDAEPVSATAYCRFLNSVAATERNLDDWFRLDPDDRRLAQVVIVRSDGAWHPVAGAEHSPMVLVSWFGANAYSLWAHRSDWSRYRSANGFLPSEAQWEYAAGGAFCESSAESDEAAFVSGQHVRGAQYKASTMPMAPVHVPTGVSSFGLHHMAGNVWQWCRDWFSEDFYQRPDSQVANPVNQVETGVRSERGGSWVGPVELCRVSYRRGRVPTARGRCLGFRCSSPVELLSN